MRSASYSLVLIVVLAAGCARPRPELTDVAPPIPPGRGVVFAVDGAGGWDASSNSLRQVVTDADLPLCVETFPWTHGWCRVIADQCDCSHSRAAGERLAARIRAYRQVCPTGEVYLVAHSAGSQVVLAAAEDLLPGSVNRIILLAPAVSACYDLRPALRTACDGIDVFWSKRDWWYLGLGVSVIGTADRQWCAAAGRVGFRPIVECPQDADLYAKLHQHPWDECMAKTGHCGGHYGAYQPAYLRAYVVPLLARSCSVLGEGGSL